jgi:hypothetical protein
LDKLCEFFIQGKVITRNIMCKLRLCQLW